MGFSFSGVERDKVKKTVALPPEQQMIWSQVGSLIGFRLLGPPPPVNQDVLP